MNLRLFACFMGIAALTGIPLASAAGDPAPTWAQQVQAQRPPFIKERKLTADEKSARGRLVSAVENDPSDDAMAALRPLALAGDEDAMLALVRGFLSRQKASTAKDDSYYLDVVLGGTWAARYWTLHGADREAALAIDNCDSMQAPAVVTDSLREKARKAELDCGFRLANGEFSPGVSFRNYAAGQSSAPRKVQFTEWSLAGSEKAESERYARIKSSLDGRGSLSPWDLRWAGDYARLHEPAMDIAAASASYGDKYRKKQDEEAARNKARSERLFHRQGTPEELWQYDMGGYSRKTSEQKLMLEDQAVAFGDAYLLKYARTYGVAVLREEHLERLCRLDGHLCAQHTYAMGKREEEVAKQRAAIEARKRRPGQITPDSFGSSTVEVRSYDQNGNYAGSQNMSRTEAELRGAK